MKVITPIQDITARLVEAGCDPDITSAYKRGYQAHTTLNVPHRTRGAGRGRNPLHRLVYGIDASDGIEIESRLWTPRVGETSILSEDEHFTHDDDDAVARINAWADAVIAAESGAPEPQQSPLPDDDGTLDDTSHLSPGYETLNYALPNPPGPREGRVAVEGDRVYIVHTPTGHPDIPAGTPALVMECEPDNDLIVLEIDSILFDLDPIRSLSPTDLVFVDAPEIEVLSVKPNDAEKE